MNSFSFYLKYAWRPSVKFLPQAAFTWNCLNNYYIVLFAINGCIWPWWLNRRCRWCGKRRDFLNNILRMVGYDTWGCDEEATFKIFCTLFLTIIIITLFISENVGMHRGNDWTKFAAFHRFHLTNSLKYCGMSLHSAFTFASLDYKCASTFRELGKYSAVTLIS